jgi:hypothetical protein
MLPETNLYDRAGLKGAQMNGEELEQQVRRALDERRGRGLTNSVASVAEILEGLNVRAPALFLNRLATLGIHEGAELTVPASLRDFIGTLAALRPRRKVIDPWCQLGQIAAEVARRIPAAEVVGVTPQEDVRRLLNRIDVPVRWMVGRADRQRDLFGSDNDLIAFLPPFNAPAPEEKSTASNELATVLLEASCHSLSPDGDILFVISPGTWMRAKRTGWVSRLQSSGFAVLACFWIPAGSFRPGTEVPALLLHIRRGEQHELFVAELPPSEQTGRVVLDNYAKHKQAPDAQLGRWLALKDFRTLPSLRAAERLAVLGRRAGNAFRLGDIAELGDWQGTADDVARTVLIPSAGSSSRPALLGATAIDLKGRHIAISPKEEVALPAYLARYFDSELGRLARDAAASGVVVAEVSKDALREATIYLPELDVQRAALGTDTKIATLLSELSELRNRLWTKPKDFKELRVALSKVNHEDRFEIWLDTLPFPLATVLWLYATQSDPKDRVDTLLHFFEAYAEFWATTLLSLFLRDSLQRHDWESRISSVLSDRKQNLDMATFGTWLTLVELLAKEGRKLRGSEDKLTWLRKQAAVADDRVLDVLFSKEVLQALHVASSHRNTWKGHGGIVTEEVAQSRLSVLQSLLGELRSVVGEHWTSYVLYRAGSFEFRGGIYTTLAERVVGTRAPFATETLELTAPAETGRLHLAGPGCRDAMPLLPLVKVMASPRTAMNACYFYNRRTKDGVRFVSYHFAEDSDVTDRFADTASAVDSLSPRP